MKVPVERYWGLPAVNGVRFSGPAPTPPPPPPSGFTAEAGYVLSGTVEAGQTFTIDKAAGGFGTTGPTILVAADFTEGTIGSPISTNAEVGGFTSISGDVRYAPGGYSGGQCSRHFNNSQMRTYLNGQAYGYYFHYKTKFGDNGIAPSYDLVETPFQWPPHSSMKWTWVYQRDVGVAAGPTVDIDTCTPTHTGTATTLGVGGNNSRYMDVVGGTWRVSNSWFGWNNWSVISSWVRDAVQEGTLNRLRMFSVNGNIETDKTVLTANDSVTVKPVEIQWVDSWNFPGWRRVVQTLAEVYYDDIYLAIDSPDGIGGTVSGSANCRVELINNTDYTDCSEAVVCLVESWSDTSVTVRVPRAAPVAGKQWRVLVHLKNGAWERAATAGV